MKLRSSIRPSLLHSLLIRGTSLALLGIGILLFSGIFIPVDQLKFLGAFGVFSALLFITLGLYPYQKLKKLEMTPHEISILDDDHFLFSLKGKPSFIVSFKKIEKIIYIDTCNQYGIGLLLKKPLLDEVKIVNRDVDIHHLYKTCQKKYECDLLLPYFSKYAFQEFKNMSIS